MAEEKTNNENLEHPHIDIEKERDADTEDAKKALSILMNYGIKQTKRGVRFAAKYGKTGLAFVQKQGKEAVNKIKQFKQKSVAEKRFEESQKKLAEIDHMQIASSKASPEKTVSAKSAKQEEDDDLSSLLNDAKDLAMRFGKTAKNKVADTTIDLKEKSKSNIDAMNLLDKVNQAIDALKKFDQENKYEEKREDVKNDSNKNIDIDNFLNMLLKAEDKPKLATDVNDEIVKPANEENTLCFNFAVDKENPLDGRIYLKLLLADTDCPTLEVSRSLNELNDFRIIHLKNDRDHYLAKIGNELYRPKDAKTNRALANLFNVLKIDDDFKNKKNDVLRLIMTSALYESQLTPN